MEANGSGSGSSSDSAPDCWDQADIETGSGASPGSAPPAAEAEAQQELLGAAFSRQLNVNAKPFVPNVHAAEFVPSFLRGAPAPGLPPPSPPPGLPPPHGERDGVGAGMGATLEGRGAVAAGPGASEEGKGYAGPEGSAGPPECEGAGLG
uniref:Ataxin-2 C-terminal domain-containing protein n=1 Tax=Pavo cristatus TaxID=9049 RepID=A0A8C9F5D3_PAVCR